MTLRQLNENNRSIRCFDPAQPVTADRMIRWIDTARICMSAVNLQPLKYRVVSDPAECTALLAHIHWAGLIPDFPHPAPGEAPTGYIVICHDTTVVQNPDSSRTDLGICAQTILLSAVEEGFGGCMIGAFARKETASLLALPEHLPPVLILALGRPAERVVLEAMEAGAPTAYYRDAEDVHHVPKRKLEDILL